jgi:hypothetical protein
MVRTGGFSSNGEAALFYLGRAEESINRSFRSVIARDNSGSTISRITQTGYTWVNAEFFFLGKSC